LLFHTAQPTVKNLMFCHWDYWFYDETLADQLYLTGRRLRLPTSLYVLPVRQDHVKSSAVFGSTLPRTSYAITGWWRRFNSFVAFVVLVI
jgi:hypothetical protein